MSDFFYITIELCEHYFLPIWDPNVYYPNSEGMNSCNQMFPAIRSVTFRAPFIYVPSLSLCHHQHHHHHEPYGIVWGTIINSSLWLKPNSEFASAYYYPYLCFSIFVSSLKTEVINLFCCFLGPNFAFFCQRRLHS